MKKTIFSFAVLLVSAGIQAQSVDDVLRSVETNNVELKALQKGNEAATLEMKQQNALEDFSVEYSPFFNGEVSGVTSSELVVKQGFDFPTLYGARRKENRLQGEVLDMQYRMARRDVLLAAKQACIGIIHLNKQKELLAERKRVADELLVFFTEKFDNGDATSLELNKVKMDRMTLETELANAETERMKLVRQLQTLNGGKSIQLETTDYPQIRTESYESMYERAASSDWSVKSAQAAVRAAEQGVKVNKQGILPKLEIGYRRNTDGDDANNGFLIGGSIPLFSNRGRVKTAKAKYEEAQMKQNDAQIRAELSARALVDEVVRLRAAADAYDVPLMRQTLQLLRTALENGQISVTDYFVETDGVYRNMLAQMAVENQYQSVLADVLKNDL